MLFHKKKKEKKGQSIENIKWWVVEGSKRVITLWILGAGIVGDEERELEQVGGETENK